MAKIIMSGGKSIDSPMSQEEVIAALYYDDDSEDLGYNEPGDIRDFAAIKVELEVNTYEDEDLDNVVDVYINPRHIIAIYP
jgi:hypothetical protein